MKTFWERTINKVTIPIVYSNILTWGMGDIFKDLVFLGRILVGSLFFFSPHDMNGRAGLGGYYEN